ncbi:IclR family transcriptional regulator [Sphaerisporangium krabiense]|uniref:DNA-binding IclR family transcriptional regulator n=1 Tax=Sphaerisporangium krabiense TaxID=763782 RepID=A0A7W8Z061_9ACTN|nr:IclR family transcriptional regulator [Sphaerisporangium krabiense]MBB5625039.1 DNA-binding IclR family transcriptional regulator [Sphaerisporangium krabiense]GII66923.1 IclR family transcriptional regulator [Sphaerisporangium krabiense]
MTTLPFARPGSTAPEGTGPAGTGDAEAMNSVLGKARLIIEAFTAEDDSLSLAELVKRTGVAKASVHRLAQELLGWGVLERAGNRYRLGLRLFEIGQRVPRQRILREAALPYMEDLLLATQETVHFAIHEGLDVLYVEKLMVHRGLRKQSRVAGRLPLFCTATGKVIIAFSPPALFHEVVRHGLTPLTHKTIIQPGRLLAQLDKIRAERLAVEVEETRLGYTSLAVPVFADTGTLAGALSITAPTFRMNQGRFTAALRTAALGISRTLQATG